MQQLVGAGRTNWLCLMMTAIGGVIVMAAIAFGFYLTIPASGT